jgi:two-component system response regulator PilR (NtrC family)
MQSKLLRAVQERAVRPIGTTAEVPVSVRIVSATHKDLEREVAEGRFRRDLFYRLNVIQIQVPPLRERTEDLPVICAAVLGRIARDAGVSPAPKLTDAAIARLACHAFPGNVRELENLLHRAVALTGAERIDAADLGLDDDDALDAAPTQPAPLDAWGASSGGGDAATAAGGAVAADDAAVAGHAADLAPARSPVEAPLPDDLVKYLDEVERDVLVRALERHRYNRTAAGASLGLSLRQMRYRMARLGIQIDAGVDAGG